jgi:hypothetical protein
VAKRVAATDQELSKNKRAETILSKYGQRSPHTGKVRRKPTKVYGIGVNDADYVVQPIINGTKQSICPFYDKWVGLLRRCSDKYKDKHPSYADVKVCDEWASFMSFRVWMKDQPWEGMQLDKDIIKEGNKIYSPSTCCFVPSFINTILVDRFNHRGDCPLGVHFCKSKCVYISQVSVKSSTKMLGSYTTAEDAHKTWQIEKAKVIEDAVELWKTSSEFKHTFNVRAADSLLRRAELLKFNAENGITTVKL